MPHIKIANWHDTLGDFTPIPAGTYLVVLSNTEQTEDGKIVLDFTIVEGSQKGATIKKFLSTTSEEACRMTAKHWASICMAVGRESEDTTQLHGQYLYIDIEVTDGKDGKKYNNIKKYISTREYEANHAPQPQFAAQPAPAYAPPAPQPQYTAQPMQPQYAPPPPVQPQYVAQPQFTQPSQPYPAQPVYQPQPVAMTPTEPVPPSQPGRPGAPWN